MRTRADNHRLYVITTPNEEIACVIRRIEFPGKTLLFEETKTPRGISFALETVVNKNTAYELLDTLDACMAMGAKIYRKYKKRVQPPVDNMKPSV